MLQDMDRISKFHSPGHAAQGFLADLNTIPFAPTKLKSPDLGKYIRGVTAPLTFADWW